MDERKQRNYDPWDDSVYGTGKTKPPKSHGGLIAGLMITVIFLSGIVSGLGLLNIKLVWKLNALQEEEANLPFSFTVNQGVSSASVEATPETESTVPTDMDGEVFLSLQPSPVSTENFPQEGGLSWQAIYEKNIPSVVSISVDTSGDSRTGTGVIFSHNGYIVTNSHVLDDARQITVLLYDDRSFTARILGNDPVSDLAVLTIDAEDLIPAEFGDADALRVGDAVAAIGDPLGLEFRGTLTDGIISAINRDVTIGSRTMTLLQTNAALNTGNSGGPLVNCYGQVIGINTVKISSFSSNDFVEGLGFAIPSTTVQDVVNQLVRQGYVSGRASLDIVYETVADFDRYFSGLPAGVSVIEMGEENSDVLEIRDIITYLNGIAVTNGDMLEEIIGTLNPGDTVDAVIYRGGTEYEVTLSLTENKD